MKKAKKKVAKKLKAPKALPKTREDVAKTIKADPTPANRFLSSLTPSEPGSELTGRIEALTAANKALVEENKEIRGDLCRLAVLFGAWAGQPVLDKAVEIVTRHQGEARAKELVDVALSRPADV